MKKDQKYKYPIFMISGTEEEKRMIKELREHHYVNVSAFFREKIKELYESKMKNVKNDNSQSI